MGRKNGTPVKLNINVKNVKKCEKYFGLNYLEAVSYDYFDEKPWK
jgi:hypothetical protein